IVLAFNRFLTPLATTANTAPKLRKKLESNGLPVSGRNSAFFRNLLKIPVPGVPGSPNRPEDIAS
ncbi:1052_t:CDS:1, partial [Rhizophagus irregularis]